MSKLLIVYGTTDGHTRRIAQRIADVGKEFGHTPFVVDAAARPVLARSDADAIIVCAPIRKQRHPKAVRDFVRINRRLLQHLPSAFFSVSLSVAGGDEKGPRKIVDAFLKETGWHPAMVRLVAGALMYRRYGWWTRRVMQLIAWRAGGDTDTRHNYEYTDWQRLAEDVEEFLLAAVPAPWNEPAVLVPA
jgi:menaquinone-dependent protoporphyrinogen oxidase